MIAQKKGAIVNFASCGAVVGWAGSVGYQCTKAGVAQMARSLAVEWGPHNIRVNAIAPGYVDTPQTRAEAALEPEFFAERIRRVPMGRGALPEEIPGTVLFLVSDAASMVTGNLVATDGGFLVA
jgi:2-deoxy-D-gluconate 3-dehydrogenase